MEKKKEPLFVALSNQKGGVGKSTLTILLASYFHYRKGKNVLAHHLKTYGEELEKLFHRKLGDVKF